MNSATIDAGPRLGAGGEPAARALSLLDQFSDRILPGFLRRQVQWKNLPSDWRHELLTELRHSLAVDCLEQPEAVCDLDPRQRHSRWFRLLEREVRASRQRLSHRIDHGTPLDELPAAATLATPELYDLLELVPSALKRLLADGLEHEGRGGMRGTAARLGICRTRVRRMWVRLAERLGYDGEFLAFWQKRLAEAALGLAADLLRHGGGLRLLPGNRPQPDLQRRRQRVRGIGSHVRMRPLPPELMRSMAQVRKVGRAAAGVDHAVRLLELAAQLSPFDPAVPLWRFEAAMLQDDHALAVRCLRRAQGLGGEGVRVLLARARLLEARGRDIAAQRLLSRGVQRYRGEARLLAALRAFAEPDWPARR